jgi:hypothetical protein
MVSSCRSRTSLATPCWAGLIAITNQQREAIGGLALDAAGDPTETLQGLYSLPGTDFHDITTGYNGIAVHPREFSNGYNDVTGRGSPIANRLVPDLASYGMPSRLAITTQPPAHVTAGQAFKVTVDVKDALGDVVTTFDGSVTLTEASGPPGAIEIKPVTVSAHDGVATFPSLVLTIAGTYTFRATSGNLTSATTTAVTVTPAAADQLVVTLQPSSVASGEVFGVIISVEDEYRNLATSFDGDVNLLIPRAFVAGVWPAPAPPRTVTVAAVDGVASFEISLANGGDCVLTATSGNLVEATTTPILVKEEGRGPIPLTPASAGDRTVATEPSAPVVSGWPTDGDGR